MTHTFSPSFVSQSKLDFNRFNIVQPVSANGVSPSYFLGSPNTATGIGPYEVGLPGDNAFSPAAGGYPFGGPQNFGEAYQDFSYTKGKHEIRFGGDIEYLRDNRSFGAYNEGQQIFGNDVGAGHGQFPGRQAL
jgi:hypothetical protein